MFTENAMKAFTTDVIDELRNATAIIASETNDENLKINAFDQILSYVDDIDTAMDFCKIGGLFIVVPALKSPFTEIRKKSAQLVAELAQNNQYGQENLLKADILPNLLDLLNKEETAVAGLRAISCMVRGNKKCSESFFEQGGLKQLLGCLQKSEEEKIITRTTFLLNALCNEFPEIRESLIEMNAIGIIVKKIEPKQEYDICLENLLALLSSLSNDTVSLKRFYLKGFDVKRTLEVVIECEKSECKEIIEYSRTILENISKLK